MDTRNMLTAAGLRDFFFARNGEQMEEAYRCLQASGAVPEQTGCLMPEAEYAFNRLFVGPLTVPAPLYASVYIESESVLMGESTLDVRDLYAAFGLSRPKEQNVPDDHLSLELDFLLCLEQALMARPDAALARIQNQFLEKHMNVWIPVFVERILADRDLPGCIDAVAQALLRLLETATAQRGVEVTLSGREGENYA
ncbi:MAG: molecular chaperone [Syntrophobacteraceae bacterium]